MVVMAASFLRMTELGMPKLKSLSARVAGSSVVYRVIYFVCCTECSEVTLLLSTQENSFDLDRGDAGRNQTIRY